MSLIHENVVIHKILINTPKQPQWTKLFTGNTNTSESVILKTNISGHSNTINNNRYININMYHSVDFPYLSIISCSSCRCRGVTLGSVVAFSRRAPPIWLCKEFTRVAVAVRMLELPPWTAPLLFVAPRRCHKRGNTCSTTCFCLRW